MRLTVIMELLRRLVAAVLIVLGGGLIAWPGPPLLVVGQVDFRQAFESRTAVTGTDLADPERFRAFVASRTDERTRDVPAESWMATVNRLRDGEDQSTARRLSAGTEVRFVFRESEAPFSSAGPWRRFQYLRIDGGAAWLSVSRMYPQDIPGLPGSFAYPGRKTGWLLLALGLGTYLILPRRRVRAGEYHYNRFASVVGGDLLGLVTLTLFGLLPLLVVWFNDPGSSVFSSWLLVAIPLWIMAALGFVLLAVGGFYSVFFWTLEERSLVRCSWRGESRIEAGSIRRVEPYRGRLGRMLGSLLVLSGRAGLTGQGLLAAANEAHGARLMLDDGRTVRVMANHLPGFEVIMAAIHRWQVPGAAPLDEFFDRS